MSVLEKIKPATEKQRMLLAALKSKDADLIGAFGPSGTGKSLITCAYGIEAVQKGEYARFIVARPIVDVKAEKEFTAAELGEFYYKLASDYLFDLLQDYVSREELASLIESGKVVLADLNFLRGRTFDRSLVFLDDAQLASPLMLTEMLIRVGTDSKLVVAGDPVFQVREGEELNGAALAREVLSNEEKAVVIDFGVKDIVRPGAKRGFKLAMEMRLRRRKLSEEEKRVMDIAYVHAPDADIITVVMLKDLKEKYELSNVPDALIVSKEDRLGRLIGRNGERINKIEKETGLFLRGVELSTNFLDLVIALHPLTWLRKYIIDVDIVGPNLEVVIDADEYPRFVGRKGSHVRFIDEALRRMMGIGVRAVSQRVQKGRKRR